MRPEGVPLPGEDHVSPEASLVFCNFQTSFSFPRRNTISAATRRDVFDVLRLENVDWAGQLEEPDFLSRLYDLDELPSHDSRFRTMGQDIWQHRVNNPMDWDDDWVFSDSRLNLLRCPDSEFLSFLCEMLHPVVRPDIEVFTPKLIWTQTQEMTLNYKR